MPKLNNVTISEKTHTNPQTNILLMLVKPKTNFFAVIEMSYGLIFYLFIYFWVHEL